MNAFVERHQASISSTLACFDRVVITGTLPDICHPRAMAGFLDYHKVRLFDFPRWAEPLREELRANAERIADEAGLTIEFVRKLKALRKEARIKEILAARGDHPGLVHIFSAWSVALSLVIPGGDILCRRDSGNGDKFFCAPDALRPPPRPTSSLGSRARRLPQMARRRIGCACMGPSLAPGPTAPAPLRPHARAYACRGLPASCFALPWRAAHGVLPLVSAVA